MKSKLSLFILLSIGLAFSCKDDDDPVVSYDYHAHISQPSASDKSIDDVLTIQVDFESHSGEAVEHINITLKNKATSAVVYNQPAEAHVPGGVSSYTFQDQFVLSAGNGVTSGDYILEAKVWGEEDGQDEVIETVEFHVHP